jgi:hypothetical protein
MRKAPDGKYHSGAPGISTRQPGPSSEGNEARTPKTLLRGAAAIPSGISLTGAMGGSQYVDDNPRDAIRGFVQQETKWNGMSTIGNRARSGSSASSASSGSAPGTPQTTPRAHGDKSAHDHTFPRPSTPKSTPPLFSTAVSQTPEYSSEQVQGENEIGLQLTPDRVSEVPSTPGSSGSLPASTSNHGPGSAKKSPQVGSAPSPNTFRGPPPPTGGGPPPMSASTSGINPYSNFAAQHAAAATLPKPPPIKIGFNPGAVKASMDKKTAAVTSSFGSSPTTADNDSDLVSATAASGSINVQHSSPKASDANKVESTLDGEATSTSTTIGPDSAPLPESILFMNPLPMQKVNSMPVHRPVYAPPPMPGDIPKTSGDSEGDSGGDDKAKKAKLIARKKIEQRRLQRIADNSIPAQPLIIRFLNVINTIMTLGIVVTGIGIFTMILALSKPKEMVVTITVSGIANNFMTTISKLWS